MAIRTSSVWPTLSLELQDASLKPSTVIEALCLAREASGGELAATGDGGDCVEVQYEAGYAVVLYMTSNGTILRPRFPGRIVNGDGVEDFFCHCCGVQLGYRGELVRCSARQEESFRLWCAILEGQLPESLPEPHPEQPYLPNMESFIAEQAKTRRIEWVELKGRRNH